MARRSARALGAATGALGALAGAAYGAQRLAAARARRHPDPDRDTDLTLRYDRVHVLPSHDGGTIRVVERGEGPPIVLSHGVTLSVRTWVKQLASLPDQGFRVLAFDHRGHGESVAGSDGHAIDALARDLRTLLEVLDLRGAVVVGHSMGGIGAQVLALRHPEVVRSRVAGLVLLSTLGRVRLAGSRWLLRAVETISDHVPDLSVLLSRRDLGYLLARIGFGPSAQPTHVELTREMILECSPQTRRLAPRSLLGLDLTPDLGAVSVPTLVVVGSADVITPPAEARRLAELVPGARLEVLEGAGHMAMLERAEEVDALVVAFARRVQSRAPRAPLEDAH